MVSDELVVAVVAVVAAGFYLIEKVVVSGRDAAVEFVSHRCMCLKYLARLVYYCSMMK